jgi:hypothetical protein
MGQEPGRALDLTQANRHGQQLFFANMTFKRHRTPRLGPLPRKLRSNADQQGRAVQAGTRVWVQPTLLDMVPDAAAVRQRMLHQDQELTRYCAALVGEHARRFGWSVRQRNDVIRSLRLLQALRDTPTGKIRATDVLQLPRYTGNISSTLDVLAEADLLIDDRPTPVHTYFSAQTAHLPPSMHQDLELWLQVMLEGARTAPRQIPRAPQTVRLHIMGIAPMVHAWAGAGRQTFAEVTPADILASLPPAGAQRHYAENGARSLFKVLRGRKRVFTDPTRGMKTTPIATNLPLALDATVIRGELNHPDPVIALAVALVAFHALTGRQIRELRTTDIADGRLSLAGRDIPLAAPVRIRLAAWLDHRNRTWPNTATNHLLINRRTAPRLVPVGPRFPWNGITLRPQALREDRILLELHATGGDVRRICDLFGLSVSGATRYLSTLEHPHLAVNGEQFSLP